MYVNAVIAASPPAINDGHDTLGYRFSPGEVPPLPVTPALAVSKKASSPQVAVGEERSLLLRPYRSI